MKPIVVRGGGDLASGIIWQLCRAGYPVIILECRRPMAIRREAAFCEAVRFGKKTVEGITCHRVENAREALERVRPEEPVLLMDEEASSLDTIRPEILVDAILAKRNLGTAIDMAPLVIGIGPGFEAGRDVDYVIETMRGHKLGRIIDKGSAMPNTGIPGIIAGHGADRVMHAPSGGLLRTCAAIGDIVKKGDTLGVITDEEGRETPLLASLDGVLRGILPDNFMVYQGLKAADIDPRREQVSNCFTISDKARCIAGSVLTLAASYEHRRLPLLYHMKKGDIVTVIGAGGKTTCVHALADYYASSGCRCVVTTTTKMLREEGLCETPEEVEKAFRKRRTVQAGKEIRHKGQRKIVGFEDKEFRTLTKLADMIFVEGDGASGHSFKVPKKTEPVIAEGTTRIVLVAGMQAVGKTLKEGVYYLPGFLEAFGEDIRFTEDLEKPLDIAADQTEKAREEAEKAEAAEGRNRRTSFAGGDIGEDTVLTPHLMAEALHRTYLKRLREEKGDIPVTILASQADTPQLKAFAESFLEAFDGKYDLAVQSRKQITAYEKKTAGHDRI